MASRRDLDRKKPPPQSNDDEGEWTHPNKLSLEALSQQMTRMQQMQDWLLQQKEHEMLLLRTKVEEQQRELIQKEVEMALLKEKLAQQEERMQHELQLIKRAASKKKKKKKKKASASPPPVMDSSEPELHDRLEQQLHVGRGRSIKADYSVGEMPLVSQAQDDYQEEEEEPPQVKDKDEDELLREEEDDYFDTNAAPATAMDDAGNAFTGYNNPMNDGEDAITLGNTVASSTYGEDRHKVVNQTILDPYGDSGQYTGVVLLTTGMPHGMGRMLYQDDGRTYDGDWRHGRWHGYGNATFANGDSYEGEYRFDQRHGRGLYQWHDGRRYNGEFYEDKRHGKGEFTWPDGAVYEGDFVYGQREGRGRYTFADGGQYVGEWVDGRYEGYGECEWEDGRSYKGEWEQGMAHGRGMETFADGTVRHDGLWDHDDPIEE